MRQIPARDQVLADARRSRSPARDQVFRLDASYADTGTPGCGTIRMYGFGDSRSRKVLKGVKSGSVRADARSRGS